MSSNVQQANEKQRAVYDLCPLPLLSQLASLHRISVRDFAAIFGISKSHAEELLNHKKLPSLELAIRIARYWEVTVDDLFGWRVDDDGARRPLVIEVDGKAVILSSKVRGDDALAIVAALAEKVAAGG